MSDHQWILYETVDKGSIAIITLNRADKRNAQHRGLLVELDEAFSRAEADDEVRVVVLRGAGSVFSSGHDLGSNEHHEQKNPGPGQHPTYRSHGGTRPGMEGPWLQEIHFFLRNTRRWRDLRKITIASVQGEVYAAGLMLMWACDLIVADETASFADVVGARLGMCGVEYFAHPWELGARKAKELLLTGDSISVDEAYRLGMVSKIFLEGRLEEDTLAFARRIAQVPTMASLAIKEAVNQTQDIQGFHNALQASMTLHELNHAHWAVLSGGTALTITPELGGQARDAFSPVRHAQRDSPGGN
ncbi:enoyl-CoA hydratase [Mycobacterium syngnathidarum]